MHKLTKFLVFSEMGDYYVWDTDKWAAMRQVERITYGRAKPYDAEVAA